MPRSAESPSRGACTGAKARTQETGVSGSSLRRRESDPAVRGPRRDNASAESPGRGAWRGRRMPFYPMKFPEGEDEGEPK